MGKNKALASALSGTIASVASMCLFYPLDVYKTNLQARSKTDQDYEERRVRQALQRKSSSVQMLLNILSTSDSGGGSSGAATPSFPAALSLLFRRQLFSIHTNYTGLSYKIIHTITSSFLYFYLSTLLRALYIRRVRGHYENDQMKVTLSVPVRISLEALAAMANVALTLPIDAIVTRSQMEAQAGGGGEGGGGEGGGGEGGGKGGDLNEAKLGNLWGGLTPSLLLSLNPALHYTLYDMFKLLLLARQNSSNGNNDNNDNNSQQRQDRLDTSQAFLAGMLAKYLATILTYPLIRSKVKMMASTDCMRSESISETLRNIVAAEGWSGLYTGLGVQLGHTVLKAAVVVSIRERVAGMTERLVQNI
jgi:hypothetical protein